MSVYMLTKDFMLPFRLIYMWCNTRWQTSFLSVVIELNASRFFKEGILGGCAD